MSIWIRSPARAGAAERLPRSRINGNCMRLKATLLVVCAIVLSGQQTPQQTLRGLRAAPGMEVTLWASEPAFSNPTNIAVDERGRIWVIEAVNYRHTLPGRNQPDIRPAGDRIVILEDTNLDGKS